MSLMIGWRSELQVKLSTSIFDVSVVTPKRLQIERFKYRKKVGFS